MLDAGYLMLDIPEFAGTEIQKNPASSIKYPGSLSIAKGVHHNGLSPRKRCMQL